MSFQMDSSDKRFLAPFMGTYTRSLACVHSLMLCEPFFFSKFFPATSEVTHVQLAGGHSVYVCVCLCDRWPKNETSHDSSLLDESAQIGLNLKGNGWSTQISQRSKTHVSRTANAKRRFHLVRSSECKLLLSIVIVVVECLQSTSEQPVLGCKSGLRMFGEKYWKYDYRWGLQFLPG